MRMKMTVQNISTFRVFFSWMSLFMCLMHGADSAIRMSESGSGIGDTQSLTLHHRSPSSVSQDLDSSIMEGDLHDGAEGVRRIPPGAGGDDQWATWEGRRDITRGRGRDTASTMTSGATSKVTSMNKLEAFVGVLSGVLVAVVSNVLTRYAILELQSLSS